MAAGLVGLIDARAPETPMVRGPTRKRLMKFQTEMRYRPMMSLRYIERRAWSAIASVTGAA
jgi:hypothetical protein